ncbi:hypothetical protein ACVWXO_000560 [Bradyrhizobium sp. LM2.7]
MSTNFYLRLITWIGSTTPQWLHVAGTVGINGLVHYRVSPRRGEM